MCKKHTKKLAKSKQNYKGLRNTRNPKPVSQEPSTQTHRNTAKTDKTKTQTAKTPAATDSVANKNMRLPYTLLPKPATDHRKFSRHTPASNICLRKEPVSSSIKYSSSIIYI
jgi:hypothetical protein